MITELLKQLRQELGQSQTQFAEACGAAQPTVSCWENGTRVPTKPQFRRILQLSDGAPLLTAKLTDAWLQV